MDRDVVSYLLERMPAEEIERYRKEGVSLAEVAEALERMEARGELPVEDAPDTGFVPFDPFVPPDASRLPPFPVNSLPPSLRYMAKAAAENLQVAVDMTAVAGLAVAALCVQGKFIINPKPGWIEQLNLYAAVIACPSDRKAPALSVMTRPLHAFEKEENERRAPMVEQYRTKKSILEKRIAGLKELAGKPTKKGEAVDLDDITELQYQLSDLEREAVKPLRLLADDTTPEALVSLMSVNDGRMGIVSDEGGIFDIIAGRYARRHEGRRAPSRQLGRAGLLLATIAQRLYKSRKFPFYLGVPGGKPCTARTTAAGAIKPTAR